MDVFQLENVVVHIRYMRYLVHLNSLFVGGVKNSCGFNKSAVKDKPDRGSEVVTRRPRPGRTMSTSNYRAQDPCPPVGSRTSSIQSFVGCGLFPAKLALFIPPIDQMG